MCVVCRKGQCLPIYMSSRAERRSVEQSERERKRQMKYLHIRLFRLLFSAEARTCAKMFRQIRRTFLCKAIQLNRLFRSISTDEWTEERAMTNEPSTSSTTSGINSGPVVIERLNRFSVYSNNKKIKKEKRRRKERIWLFVFKEIQHRQMQLNQRSPLLIHSLF